jgi:hypothetical protein
MGAEFTAFADFFIILILMWLAHKKSRPQLAGFGLK